MLGDRRRGCDAKTRLFCHPLSWAQVSAVVGIIVFGFGDSVALKEQFSNKPAAFLSDSRCCSFSAQKETSKKPRSN